NLIEELRENESGVYGANARGSMSKVPYGSYNFTINFPCGPENAETLAQSALRELNKIIENGPDEKDLNKFKEAEKLDYKEKIKQNNYWMSYLTRSFTYGVSADEILQVEQKIDA